MLGLVGERGGWENWGSGSSERGVGRGRSMFLGLKERREAGKCVSRGRGFGLRETFPCGEF